jgi:CreA protein
MRSPKPLQVRPLHDRPPRPAYTAGMCHVQKSITGPHLPAVLLCLPQSTFSLACRQIGPIRIKAKFEQGEDVFRKRRSLFFKRMQIVRGCDVQRNVLVYMVYSDRLIEGSPKNSTSTVPIMPWGASDQVQRCADFVEH